MSKLKELEALADAADKEQTQHGSIPFDLFADLYNAANPATIKAMCKLMVQMRDALSWADAWIDDASPKIITEALAAFNDFDKDKLNEN